jgi:ABC-2 type transport system permease protein
MIRLVRAEFLKVRTTQVWFWLLMAALALSALLVIAPLASGDINSQQDAAQMFANASTAYIVVFVLGVLGVTTEFRYQTITASVLTTPSRWALVTAKMITFALLGGGFAAACVILQLAIGLPWLATKHLGVSPASADMPRALLAVFAILALFGIVGLGVGALLRNQIVAVVVGIIFLAALQNIVLAIPKVRSVWPYLPGGATTSISAIDQSSVDFNGVHLLPVWGAVVVLLLWAFVPAVIGAAYSMNRDIT